MFERLGVPERAFRCSIMTGPGLTECGAPATFVDKLGDRGEPWEGPECWVAACEPCLAIVMAATARRDQEAAFTEEHGYPPYWDFAEGLRYIRDSAARLKRAQGTKVKCPDVVLNQFREALLKRVGYMRAYLKACES